MKSLLIIRLHPVDPIAGDDFTSYLEGLSIAAHELSFSDPDGSGPAFDTADYIAPTLPPSPSPDPAPIPDPSSRITQHFENVPGLPGSSARNFFAVATAVLEIQEPPAGGEFKTADIRLVITRGGSEIVHKQTYYNVPVNSNPIPADPNDFQTLQPISLHLELPSPGHQLDPTVTVSEDGTAPNFEDLKKAVENVLNAEPGSTAGIADLTIKKCRHIAYEIIWDRQAYPLPVPKRSLEEMYTGPHSSSSDEERDRRIFEGDLLTYYVKHNNEADRLANFVFSLSAAIWCEEKSKQATQVGFCFPVFPDSPEREAKVILKGVGAAVLDPVFSVPAEYFYALTAILPPQVNREQRFKMTKVDAEAQTVENIKQALDDQVLTEPAGVNPFQAARRLRALGLVGEVGTPECQVDLATDIHGLVSNWLGFNGEDINVFWGALTPGDVTGHLDLILCTVTKAHKPLETAIKADGVNNVGDLAAKTSGEWEALLNPDPPNPGLLPGFTKPGTTEERTQAFIRHLRKFFDVTNVFDSPGGPIVGAAPELGLPAGNPLRALLSNYPGVFSFSGWDAAQLAATLSGIFPGDPEAQQQFTQWLTCIRDVINLTGEITPDKVQFSVIEALWARGFTNAQSIQGFSFEDFKEALVGSVAYDHALTIWNNAGVGEPGPAPGPEGFKPVNPDGSIINCIPPAHLSPLGSVSYLHDLLQVSEETSCDDPIPLHVNETLATLLAGRRGALGDLLATKANLEVPIPLIDIVNESLEFMVAEDKSFGTVYNTAGDQVGGHELISNPTPSADTYQHDPEIMFEALPEHSTPAVPTAQQTAYDKLKKDFSACNLPYSQPLDVLRTYLGQLSTSRFEVMHRFRKDITEFVLDPAKETTEFQKHLWRYPVRIETAIEYLGITPEEYSALFQKQITNAASPAPGKLSLYQLFGFPEKQDESERDWTETVILVSEFLERTCLAYCEFIELWKSEFVKFGLKGNREEGFPECEPCCLDKYVIGFIDPLNEVQALKRLIVFIRLWRKLQALPNAGYTFTELRDICEVLELFKGANVNPDFIRQLAAFQMFRDDFELSLTDGTTPGAGATGAERLHLLAFWVPGASKRNWAVEHLLYQIQQYAVNIHGCGCREPEFIKLLTANLGPLSALAGFDPTNPIDTWDALPTHTLRFAEILAKIYASEFRVGELLFLFTNDEHLQGDDPFPLQTKNEAKDSPLGLPDDECQYSLWSLRKKLIAVEVSAEAAQQWTWARMGTALREEFGFAPLPGNNRWLSLGQHFFPGILSDSGIAVSIAQRQYRVPLLSTSELMWNTPPDGPFRYDATAKELWTQAPLTDEAVLAKLGRIRQLTFDEQNAVQELYFLPRVDLAHFAFIFNNFGEAEERMIQEPNEAKRWAWFQREFDRFYQRCRIIAEHLAAHTADEIGGSNPEGTGLAKLLLKNLWADENMATTPWENDNGQSPPVTWHPQPNGGAYAALLGLKGTGMLAEYFDAAQSLRWHEVRGGTDAFGPEENAWNAPIPTIMPSMDFTFSPEQLRFAAVRNGFAIANTDGAMLGGAEPFTLHWKGLLLIDYEGQYEFSAGAPTPAGEVPDFEKVDQSHRWRVILKQGQKTWVLLSHDWPKEEAPAACSEPIALKKGFYELDIELERKPVVFDGPEDVCPQTTGFQLKYKGPDAGGKWLAVPFDKLFQDKKNATLQIDDNFPRVVQSFLAAHYTSTIRDMRRTYQRAFKALVFVNRLGLSAQPIADDGQSELGYMLSHPVNFSGQSYYRSGGGFVTHKANFDLNFLPVLDNYEPPLAAQDQRAAPSTQRRQAMFDWWERLLDYTVMRAETRRSPEQPVWLLFHESAETHTDRPAQLLRHLGVDLRHDTLVLQFFDAAQGDLSYDVTSNDLEDDRWAVRVWQSEKWVCALIQRFYAKDITSAKVFLWASDGPEVAGNANLTQFYRDGCIENEEPRRYEEIKRLNDGLRQRGGAALVAYLTHMNRVALPWGGFAGEAKHLSELLLLDVEVGLCQKASRIEEAISALQLYVQRARLGLEPGFAASPEFLLAWERHFATLRTWEACKRRAIYRENWIEWDELQGAKQTEAFQFLESELRRAALTMPVPGSLAYWSGSRPPAHSGVTLLQHREPATMQTLDPVPEGLGLMGTPDRHARPTWLAPLNTTSKDGTPDNIPIEIKETKAIIINPQQPGPSELPMWLQAAVRLGVKFIRVAAAGIPPATTIFGPKCDLPESSPCCTICGKTHPALIDEYYFWIEESRYYDGKKQVAEWGTDADADNPQTDWHRTKKLPGLLHWESNPMVHLRWCRMHNGEFQQPRQSYEGVRIKADTEPQLPQLVFSGRGGDSLYFEIAGGEPPESPPGFRYDLAVDEAITLPQVEEVSIPDPALFGGLSAYPFFAWFDPGAPLLPPSQFSTVIAIAGHLRAHCRFEEALKWYESVYNPLLNDNTWIICPPGHGETGAVSTTADECCCASDPVPDAEVKERAVLMHYLDTLLHWGEALMRKNTPEVFQQARLIVDTAAKILGNAPITVLAKEETLETFTVANFKPECAPINPRLMCLYTSVNDGLALIHSCLNAWRLKNGRPNLDMPYFGSSEIRECRQVTHDVCADEGDWCMPQSPYRFLVLVQKAQEIANEVRTLGSALLAAYEKDDAEYLASMRSLHERQLLNLALEVRQNQWREADWQVQALQKTKQISQTRLHYYTNLIANGLNSGESQYEPLIISSTTVRAAGNISQAIGQAINLIPDPYVGFPSNFVKLPVGTKLSMIFSAAGTIASTVADILNSTASLGLTKGGWDRREDEWQHQVDVLTIEIEQIERQILAAERRRDISLRELNNHQQQIENAAEVHDFLRDKFTNHALYLWMQQETAAIYYQMYEMALHCARQAQRAFNFERGHTTRQFIPAEIWDNLHEGLLSGERLQLAIRHMEKAYYDENVREYELSKRISLRLHFPMAFLQLKTTGYCEVDIPEWMFDLDYPGHYMRRIKNVSLTIPCVVGPYTGVHCRLTLLSSKIRVDSRLGDPPHTCCHDERWKNGYQAMPDDTRILSMYAATEAIATSSGQNDSGMFELNFRDERYLPFEFAGAVSRWRIELPLENNHFDMETLSDVILHLNFTAREGGENLRKAANECAQENLPGAGLRFFDVRHEFPDIWHSFSSAVSKDSAAKLLGIRLSRNMFPFLTGNKKIGVQRLEIFFEAPGADPSKHHIVEFLTGQRVGQIKKEKCDCDVHSIACVADVGWPGLFHGVLETDFGEFNGSGYQDLGVFRFPAAVGDVTDVYLFCGYSLV